MSIAEVDCRPLKNAFSFPNASIGDIISIKTIFPIKNFGNDGKGISVILNAK